MSSRATFPALSESASGNNLSASDQNDVYTGLIEQGDRSFTLPSSELISRRRYHSQRNVSSNVSNPPTRAERLPDLPPSGYGTPSSSDMSADSRRQNLMAMDRKRRLTGSHNDGDQRRHGHGRFHGQEDDTERLIDRISSSTRPPTYPHRRGSSHNQSAHFVDLTNSSPSGPNQPMPPTPSTHISRDDSESIYVVPRWQPDSEVSSCPICKRQFSFLFRRHHCRKCGRVVCNDCSPHRITIPRQYIVSHPSHRSYRGIDTADVIDLTGEDDDQGTHDETDTDEDIPNSDDFGRHVHSRFGNFTQGGGEKVRLCNPCVPDPQPEHLPIYGSRTLPIPPTFPQHSNSVLPYPPQPGLFPHPRIRSHGQPFSGVQQPQYMPPFNHSHMSRSYRNHTQPLESAVPLASSNPAASSSYQPERHVGRSTSLRDHGHGSHGRYHSLDHAAVSLHHGARPRVRSMLDDAVNISRLFPAHPISSRTVQLSEDDICPVCRRALPPKGLDGDETEREAHIMQCITSRDPNAQVSNGRLPETLASPPRGPMHMLAFVATEKDCIGEDGASLECSICMVEYDVGEQLARLECLCKFHRECIASWFDRKQECPVHKIA